MLLPCYPTSPPVMQKNDPSPPLPRVFDLDAFDSERPTWIEFLNAFAPADFWRPFFAAEDYEGSFSRQQDVNNALLKKSGVGIEHVKAQAQLFFRQTYSHIYFYHGTRIHDEQSFLKSGLVRTSIASLNEQAREVLGSGERLDAAIQCVRDMRYSTENERKVGVWYSRRALLFYGSYCYKGSEYLNILSQKMGAAAHEQMTSRGRKAVVRCTIPMNSASFCYPSMVEIIVKRLFQHIEPPAPVQMYLDDAAVMLPYDVPPEWIDIEFI